MRVGTARKRVKHRSITRGHRPSSGRRVVITLLFAIWDSSELSTPGRIYPRPPRCRWTGETSATGTSAADRDVVLVARSRGGSYSSAVPRPFPWFDRTWERRVIVSTLLSLILASIAMIALLWDTEHRRHLESAEGFAFARSDGGDLPKLWQAPSFSLINQYHHEVTRDSLQGQPFVADFIYTQCTSACPMLTSRMVMLERSLAGVDVRFVSFSVDPAHDTPDVLAAYAAQWNERETRWTLLATTEASLADVSSGFRVATEKIHDQRNPILHTDLFFLVDAGGFVRGVYPSDAGDSMVRLVADVRRLTIAAPAALDASEPLSKNLYASLGCRGCHENPKLAPPLVNLRGAERMLQDGSKVTIDDAYLRRAILEPGAEVVSGYAPLMPSYRHYLNNSQLDALLAELDARTSADAGTAEANVAVVVDPVCGMKVRAVPEAPHLTFQGKEVYFCSDTCRDEFAKHPSRYFSETLAGIKKNADR
jgi:protein SCO1/2